MMTKIFTASLCGMKAELVTVETDLQSGLPAVNMVGLADTTIKEAKERIRAAIINSGYGFPKQRLTVNLSPAGTPKEGSHFDLPIAMGILLLGSGRQALCQQVAYIGELSLDGRVRHIRGALPLAMGLWEQGVRKLVLPRTNLQEAALLRDMELYPVDDLRECLDFIMEGGNAAPWKGERVSLKTKQQKEDFHDVIGQEVVKRAVVTAAAGNHGLLLMGSPGSGKTMIARRIPGILPDMSCEEALEITRIYSAAGLLSEEKPFVLERPFRSPHHSISRAAMIGGGRNPRPGEISLAHNGVLFLDEFGEFDLSLIEMLRQPMEAGEVTISRSWGAVSFPCRTMIVAAANPCKCGYLGDERHICTCAEKQLNAYLSRFSGPILDRIDLHAQVFPVPYGDLETEKSGGLSTEDMSVQVKRAANIQKERYRNTGIRYNSRLAPQQVQTFCPMTKEAAGFLKEACEKMALSMRTYYKIIKVSRTIADLHEMDTIDTYHIAEALRYRTLDRFYRRPGHGN
ncbi:ATP-binding protein [Clostridiales bacterium]|nr:ATP-binding protein [Clostridiales bacterium]